LLPTSTPRALVGVEDPGGDQVQGVALAVDDDGVAGVGPAVVADDDVVAVGQQVDDLALALVTPLESDDRRVAWGPVIGTCRCWRRWSHRMRPSLGAKRGASRPRLR
jgi:hypothetical protein